MKKKINLCFRKQMENWKKKKHIDRVLPIIMLKYCGKGSFYGARRTDGHRRVRSPCPPHYSMDVPDPAHTEEA